MSLKEELNNIDFDKMLPVSNELLLALGGDVQVNETPDDWDLTDWESELRKMPNYSEGF